MITKSMEVRGLAWRTARRSVGNGACVEVTPASGHILVRDSKDRSGPVINYSERSWRQFVTSAKAGRFNPRSL